MTETAGQSLEAVFTDQRQRLVWMLARIVGCPATAEDLAQEAYIKAAAAARERPVDTPRAFLLRTARNLALDHLRRDRIRQRLFEDTASETLDGMASGQPSPEAGARDRQLLALLGAALSAVPPRARQVLILSRLEGWTFPEISAHLGISSTTVQKDLRLALAHCLAAAMDKDLL